MIQDAPWAAYLADDPVSRALRQERVVRQASFANAGPGDRHLGRSYLRLADILDRHATITR
jgi:hypothetical protein